jgi:hypothetical protein
MVSKIINYFKKITNILLFFNMVKKVFKESIYKEYERYICDEMDDNEKSRYVKSRNFFLVTRINLDIK